MNICLTGGDRSVGKIFVDRGAFSFDVGSGFDIRTEVGRNRIVSASHNYDLFINHTYTEDSSQLELLSEVSRTWMLLGKRGHIINTGTIQTHIKPNFTSDRYISYKTATDEYCKSLYKKWINREVQFKTTNIKYGDLTEDFYDFVMWLYKSPADTCVGEIVIEHQHI
jgi:hypothetical protein